MKKEDIIKFAQAKGDPNVTKNLIANFELIKRSPDLTMENIQFIFGNTKKNLQELLVRDDEFSYKISVACLVDEVMDYMNLIGEESIAQQLQRVYEELFTGLIAERMWEIARETTYPTKTN
jgi:hypothetical protein